MRWLLFFFLPLFAFCKQTICLNMIVKDEKPVILKCLSSVKPLIDYWVIVDTGSTDGTQQAIREFMKDIPGELHELPWRGFAKSRNDALNLAKGKGDYCMIVDADHELVVPKNFAWPELTAELYGVDIHLKHVDGAIGVSPQIFLIKTNWDAKWVGILHEQIQSEKPFRQEIFKGLHINTDTVSGHRAQDPEKYLKDAALLKQGLSEEPDNARYQFHLGASYEMAGEFALALEAFQKCSQMAKADPDERWRSLFQVGMLEKRLGKLADQFLNSLQKAYRHDRSRAEPLFQMAGYYIDMANFQKAYELLKEATQKQLPQRSFVERSIYTWAALYNLTICAAKLGHRQETQELLERLLLCKEMPQNYRELTKQRLEALKNNKSLHAIF